MERSGRLEGKTAIITGGAQGIGRAYCLRFAEEGAEEGAEVACIDLRIEQANEVAKEITDAGVRAIALDVDITSEPECASMATEVKKEFGSVEYLINNAAGTMPPSTTTRTSWISRSTTCARCSRST